MESSFPPVRREDLPSYRGPSRIILYYSFGRLQELADSHRDLARKLAELEKKYDAQFKVVFDAIRELMMPSQAPAPRVKGFRP